MNNYVCKGQSFEYQNIGIEIIPAGTAVAIGALIAVAAVNIHPGDTGVCHLDGVYQLKKKAGETWTQGQALWMKRADSVFTNAEPSAENLGDYVTGAHVYEAAGASPVLANILLR